MAIINFTRVACHEGRVMADVVESTASVLKLIEISSERGDGGIHLTDINSKKPVWLSKRCIDAVDLIADLQVNTIAQQLAAGGQGGIAIPSGFKPS